MWTEIIYLEHKHYIDDYIFNYSLTVYANKLADNTFSYSIHSEKPTSLTEFYYDSLGEMLSAFETKAKTILVLKNEQITDYEFKMIENLQLINLY